MTRLHFLFVVFVAHLAVLVIPAHAQIPAAVAFEGHAFDAKTLRPLENVLVTYQATFAGGIAATFGAYTNSNGFYLFDFAPPEPSLVTSVGLIATCNTKKGPVVVPGIAYEPLRTEVYRRDFYVTLPKGVSKCAP